MSDKPKTSQAKPNQAKPNQAVIGLAWLGLAWSFWDFFRQLQTTQANPSQKKPSQPSQAKPSRKFTAWRNPVRTTVTPLNIASRAGKTRTTVTPLNIASRAGKNAYDGYYRALRERNRPRKLDYLGCTPRAEPAAKVSQPRTLVSRSIDELPASLNEPSQNQAKTKPTQAVIFTKQ